MTKRAVPHRTALYQIVPTLGRKTDVQRLHIAEINESDAVLPPLVLFSIETNAFNNTKIDTMERKSRDENPRFELIPTERRSAALGGFVAEQAVAPAGENGGGLERGDLIRPTGAVLKFIHSDDPDDKAGPKFEASFEVGDEDRAERRVENGWGGFLTERGTSDGFP